MSFMSLSLASVDKSFEYNICNGLANQLIQHISAISHAITNHLDVNIPDAFIVSGAQISDLDLLPSETDFIPLRRAFDIEHMLNHIHSYGIAARIVAPRIENCIGFSLVGQANQTLMMDLLTAFRPSHIFNSIISQGINSLRLDTNNGVCFHHRDGQDWKKHCERWSSIDDGVYRGNCLGLNESLDESLEVRGLDSEKNFIFFCGDDDFPKSIELSNFDIITKRDVLSVKNVDYIQRMYGTNIRDVFALIDFFLCETFETFVGNSVSTWSALQIVRRRSESSYWYNSGSVPLSTILHSYFVPIVYTYTERSATTGKFLLKASILSVRKHMPECPIHILYNGDTDNHFLKWLKNIKVTIHYHDPAWKGDIETMRLTGSEGDSHLFAHSGNYFGTWQRIDLPLFIKAEYCLLLDSDTVVKRSFTLADFGLKLTSSISMGAEFNPHDTIIKNAGVMLMNIPYLRKTHSNFLAFVLAHRDGQKYNNPCPSDQGAYIDFYGESMQVLPGAFNFKPYWNLQDHHFDSAYIIHFHGVKPFDYQKKILGITCDPATDFICNNIPSYPFLCASLQLFYKSLNTDPIMISEFCEATFVDFNVGLCQRIVTGFLAASACQNTTDVVLVAVAQISFLNDASTSLPLISYKPQNEVFNKENGNIVWYHHLFPFSLPFLVVFYCIRRKHFKS